jgi:hypothetical protein
MPTQRFIKLDAAKRLLLLVPAVAVLVLFVFVFRWCVADSAATRVSDKEIARFTTLWAPGDPQTHYTLALLSEKTFLPEDMDQAAKSYEIAAALSPFDYRYWLPLAAAREHVDDREGAERALDRALELAPNYAQVHWAAANVMLRRGEIDQALSEMRVAIDKNPSFAVTAATTALQFSKDTPAGLAEKLGNSSDVKAAIALALARQKKFDDAATLWSSIPTAERGDKFKDGMNSLLTLFLADKKFRFAAQIDTDPGKTTVSGMINPGFEDELDVSSSSPFDWKIAGGAQPRIGFDEQEKFQGRRSLGLFFAKNSGKDFRTVSQTVLVDANSAYSFTVYFHSEMTTTGGLRWEISDAGTGDLLAASGSIDKPNDGWQILDAQLKTGAQTEAVVIRLARAGCENCSIEGKLWFDNFSLAKNK